VFACMPLKKIVTDMSRKPTFKFEGEIICQMTTFMVSAQQEQGVGVPDLE
jgi:hypothetical protein